MLFKKKKQKNKIKEPNNLLGANKVKGKTIEYIMEALPWIKKKSFLNHNPMG